MTGAENFRLMGNISTEINMIGRGIKHSDEIREVAKTGGVKP
jgi:hypothetical protein